MKNKAIGILGGTFDPIHFGHLIAGEYARHEFDLDRIIFIPSARPPHKDNVNVLDSNHRYNMVKLATQENMFFEVSTLEMERQGYSYTVDTVKYFATRYEEAEIYFIMGVDALLFINTWKNLDELIAMCKFIIVTRPGYELNQNDQCFNNLPSNFWESIEFLEIPGMDISSTDIRDRVQQNKTIKYLLPRLVEEYIKKHNLYKGQNGND
ncbi:Nicotinate-nucleotide adenylyltransferase [Candidatus Syntrophocurvum alkaliphilum]|uniref:Probable nicotinate-nucleotide adenylyltransferase n=2 Tax=Candidatus Syntrophocurvum alkaliphilum TaxID=2293317 RepID=A0A6I6DG76_9FIRM|nr:Nicotinate-nucleotide adenylyltransferase [Candidatus Syntrophocurvum alkaliphilum]